MISDLDLPIPTEPHHVIASLCDRMAQRLDRPVRHRLVPFPPGVSGIWAAKNDAYYILCEKNTSPWHQMLITGHEMWHIETGDVLTAIPADIVMDAFFPSLRPDAVVRIAAARTDCTGSGPAGLSGKEDAARIQAEQEAELFGSMLAAKVSRWLPRQEWTVPPYARGVVARLESSLGRGVEPQGHK
ncbi:hypothetical protein O7626_30240 [Micromonospora sp. WMMD1102]|uniref:hypothetical protein n=1 Tax=Micromonospora sp. WMMD1102 TaxID=3016105 RepID=UPI0024156BC5|nr:hypothetical protein [Micromonospora sp. WMMD1102]MDG4790151.1 hypothetical protein [Micromonospora sp. WMMD1102]